MDFLHAIRSIQRMPINAATTAPLHADYAVVLERAERAEAALAALQAAFDKLQPQFQTLLRQRFGSTSESADQLTLFGSPEVEVIERTVVVADAPIAPKRQPTVERQRLIVPADLPEQRIEIDVPEHKKVDGDGNPLKRIGEEVTVKLGFTPPSFFKKVIVRPERSEVSVANTSTRATRMRAWNVHRYRRE